jgi:hypothetical protein
MKKYRIDYPNGTSRIVYAHNVLEVVKQNDLCTRENCKAKVEEVK